MTMKAMAAMETPNIIWCSLVSLSKTLLFDCVSLSRCLSIMSGECADLWTSAMSECRLSSFLCLSWVSLVATDDRVVSSFLIASNSSPSLCPLFLSISVFSSAKFFSMAAIRLPRASIACAICDRNGWVSTTSLKTMLVRSLMASDSARWSLKLEASCKMSSEASETSLTSASGTASTSASDSSTFGSWLPMWSSVNSTVQVLAPGTTCRASSEPSKWVRPMCPPGCRAAWILMVPWSSISSVLSVGFTLSFNLIGAPVVKSNFRASAVGMSVLSLISLVPSLWITLTEFWLPSKKKMPRPLNFLL
mmetsp:Transcript_54286/g.174048  ORF Transcript_54286/g.174048 Transcript_54286/m.174048 type:complete len:306 (+) Transcript_54286:219-1136(+)